MRTPKSVIRRTTDHGLRVIIFLLLIFWSSQAFALPPVRDDYPHKPKSDWLSRPEALPLDFDAQRLAPLSMLAPAAPAPELQFDKPWKTLIVLVEFSDKPAQGTPAYFQDLLFGKHAGAHEGKPYPNVTMADFYESMSGGKLTFEEPQVFGWWVAPQTYDYYARYSGSESEFRGCHGLGAAMDGLNSGAIKLMEWVVDELKAKNVDLAQYDNDDDGQLDGLFIVHAGAGGEQTYVDDRNPCVKSGGLTQPNQGGDIWSHQYRLAVNVTVQEESGPVEKALLLNYLMGPAQSASSLSTSGLTTVGVWAHEFGHMLWLPDLYADAGYGVGCWDLMGYAISSCSYEFHGEDPGEDPNEMAVWTRSELGWSAPREVAENVCNRRVDPAQFGGETFKVTPDAAKPNDYFLVEYRGEVGMDRDLLSDFSVENRNRVCVWHIDGGRSGPGVLQPNTTPCYPDADRASCASNHYGVALVEFDQNESLAAGTSYVEAADCMGPASEMSTAEYEGLKTWSGTGEWLVRTGNLGDQGSISIIVDPTLQPVKPQIVSSPRSAERGSSWSYQPKLVEASGLPQWSLVEYPAGMTIDTETGRMTWKVPFSYSKNSVPVKIMVENCGGSAEQAFKLQVFDPEVRGCACATAGQRRNGWDFVPFALLFVYSLRRRRGKD